VNAALGVHLDTITKAFLDGRVVPFLGAGVNLCGRPPNTTWRPRQPDYLPSGAELASYLAENFGYPSGEPRELARVSQYVTLMTGPAPLYDELHGLLDGDFPPTPLHDLLAALPRTLREKRYPHPNQLIVTTNYDDVLERAFAAAGEPVDLASYVAEGEQRGKFLHWLPDGTATVVEKPNEYRNLSLDQRSVILKIHGAIDRTNPERDSYVITEDHYIDYLTRTDLSNLVPVRLAAKLRKSHFLFLGYGLRDWNLRVILHRIWGEQRLHYKSWAIQLNPPVIDQEFWRKRDVDIIDVPLEEYLARLGERLGALPGTGAGA
jgi:hypothetical protein